MLLNVESRCILIPMVRNDAVTVKPLAMECGARGRGKNGRREGGGEARLLGEYGHKTASYPDVHVATAMAAVAVVP